KLAIVRSMTHRIANHNPGSYLAMTGFTPTRDAALVEASPADWPPFGSVLSRFGETSDHVPPFVQIPHISGDGAFKCPGQWGGLLGSKYDPLIVVGDPSKPGYRVDELRLPAEITV